MEKLDLQHLKEIGATTMTSNIQSYYGNKGKQSLLVETNLITKEVKFVVIVNTKTTYFDFFEDAINFFNQSLEDK